CTYSPTTARRGTLAADAKTHPQAEKLADRAIAWMKEQTPQDLTDQAKKDTARRCWYAVDDLEAVLNHKPQVAQTYDQIMKQFGASDETLLRFGDWQKSINDYEAA